MLVGCPSWSPPTFTLHPTDMTVPSCEPVVSFSVQVSGGGSLSYQWQEDKVDLTDDGHYSGVTTDTMTISEAVTADAGNYRCVVRDVCGYAPTDEATLSVTATLAITEHPVDQSPACGESAIFTVEASSNCPLITYQWQKDGLNLSDDGHYSGITTDTLIVSDVAGPDAGWYRCVVSDISDSLISDEAELGFPRTVSITGHPIDQTVLQGDTATFNVYASSEEPLTYQWQKDEADLSDGGHYSGAATSTLVVSNVDASDAGGYRCVVSVSCDYVFSNPAALTPAVMIPNDGAIFVAWSETNLNEHLTLVDPTTGAQTDLGNPMVSPGGSLWDIDIDSDGRVIIAQCSLGEPWLLPAVIKYDPLTDSSTVVSSGGLLSSPTGIGLAPNGDIFVADYRGSSGAVVRVDPATGSQTELGPELGGGGEIAVTADGAGFAQSSYGYLYAFDIVTGAHTLITGPIGADQDQFALTIDGSGDPLLGVEGGLSHPDQIVRVYPETGTYDAISIGDLIESPFDVTLEADGNIIMVNCGFGSSPNVVRVNRDTGDQTELTSFSGSMPWVFSAAVYVRPKPIGLVLTRPSMHRAGEATIVPCGDPELLDIDDAHAKYVVIYGVGAEPEDDLVHVLLDLHLPGSVTVADVVTDLVAEGFEATTDDPSGQLAEYGFDVLLTFDNPRTGGPLFFAWDFSDYLGAALVDRVAARALHLPDCNSNGLSDECDISSGTSSDCQPNGVPDECELTGNDCNTNDIPDECEAQDDCQPNGVQDICDIALGTSQDCQQNGVPDECDIAGGGSLDCNGTLIPDECEAIENADFDANGIVDLDDFAGFADCMAGPGVLPTPPSPECVDACLAAFDFDSDDSDVDLGDFAAFQEAFGGL